jgi:glycosyltransferase involved in cell wall biosynthesis
MHILYIALDPLKYPRIKKLAGTFQKHGNIDFDVMIPKFRVVYRGGRIGRFLMAVINYFAVLLQIFVSRADLFMVANCPDILVFPLALRRRRYVFEYRSPWAVEVEDEFGSGPWVRITAFIERFALQHAWIITLTTSRLLVRVKGYGKPVFVIPNYPFKAFGTASVSSDEFKESLGYGKDSRIVLFVGKLTRVEGADMLPKIVEDVLDKADVFFWVVGSGPLYPMLEEFAKRFSDNVRLFGWQPHEMIPNFISASDVCIAPRHRSIFSDFYNEEGVTKISEYMYFGKPIIACGVAESREYLLVDEEKMAEGILKALNGQVQSSRRRTWEDFSEKRVSEMLSLIQSGKI